MSVLNKAAIYCRDTGIYGSFEPDYPHSSVAYQAGSAMTYIIDKKLEFYGLYVDEADSTSSLEDLSRDCAKGKIDAIIVRDLDVLGENDNLLLWLEDNIPIPFIGVEDLDSTKENLNVETLEYENEEEERHHSDEHKHAIRESVSERTKEKQDEGIHIGRTPYGYQKAGDDLVAEPEEAPVVRKIFELFLDGYKLNDIRRYLRSEGIKAPIGTEWNLPGVTRILQREAYCGGDHIQPLVSRETFNQAGEMLTTKNIKKDDLETDVFPMAVCDVCGKKLTFKRSRGIYLCDRHTGDFPKEKKLDHAPKISVQDLTKKVAQQYNEHLSDMGYFREKQIWVTDLCIEERGYDKIELGKQLLSLDPDSEDYHAKVDTVCEKYEGLWLDWVQTLRNLRDDYHHALLRDNLPDIWRPMYRFDPRVVNRSVSSIRLKEDGTVETHFKAEQAFGRQGNPLWK